MTIEAQYPTVFVMLLLPACNEFFVQNLVSFSRQYYKRTHTDFRNHIYLKSEIFYRML